MIKKICRYLPGGMLAVWLLSLLLIGCQNQAEAPADPELQMENPLRIGLVPDYNIFLQKKRYEPLAAHLADKMGVEIELKIFSSHGQVIRGLGDGKLEGAFLGSLAGALAISQLDAEPLVRLEDTDGASTYTGLIFTHKDSGLSGGAEMRGRKFVFVDKATMAGWLFPLQFFKDRGIENFCATFSEWYFTGTHEDAIYDVLQGRADIGSTKSTVLTRLAVGNRRITEELKIMATSPAVPEVALFVRGDLEPALKNKLKTLLLQLDRDPAGRQILKEFDSSRYIETLRADYQPVFQFAERLGVALDSYDYSTAADLDLLNSIM
jgi:phosphonate transport system substrate-binding protein